MSKSQMEHPSLTTSALLMPPALVSTLCQGHSFEPLQKLYLKASESLQNTYSSDVLFFSFLKKVLLRLIYIPYNSPIESIQFNGFE